MAFTNNSARRTVSTAAGSLLDADGIKTSYATVTSPVTVVPADFNGVQISSSTGKIIGLPRVVTITRSNNANQFSVSPIVMTYKRGGEELTTSVTPANDDGNDTLVFTPTVDEIVSIEFPAQGGTGGTFTIGVRDICAPVGDRFCGVMVHASGNLVVQYGDQSGSPTDTIPAIADHVYEIAPSRIVTTSMSVGVTVFLP
jgi:hypothetical protein